MFGPAGEEDQGVHGDGGLREEVSNRWEPEMVFHPGRELAKLAAEI